MEVFFLTAIFFFCIRFETSAFANPEDQGKKKVRIDERVERVRRVHQNDLENIPIFCIVAFLFVHTNPPPSAAYYFYTFTVSRLIHTLSYLFAIQPFRAIAFFVGVLSTVGMAVQVIMYSLA